MSEPNPKNKAIIRLVVLLILLLLGAGGWYFLVYSKQTQLSRTDWIGSWDITYHYEHQPNLIYSGILQINDTDSLTAFLEVFPPKGIRAEKIALEKIELAENAANLQCMLVHDQYKIAGGYMRQQLELQLQLDGQFTGQGTCLAYCAEGTEGKQMVWTGKRESW